jgi:N6-adenosine-specific RNA methylase IME4
LGAGVSEHTALSVLTKARHALAEAKTLCEVKAIRDQGHAAIKLAKQHRDVSFEALADAAEITILAERKLGEMLAVMDKNEGGRPSQTGNTMLPVSTLSDLGISKMQSSRWQAEAAVDDDTFSQWVEECRQAEKLPTSTGLIKLGRCQPTPEMPTFTLTQGVVSTLDELIGGEKFACIYADPPWQYGNQATRAATGNHYGTMSVEDICNEPVVDIVADNAHLHLWTTNAFLFDARSVMEAWGFQYKSCLVWVKPQMGIGNYWRVSHEFMLFGIRGKLPFMDRGQMSWIQADRTKHSQKPYAVRAMVEKVSPGPRLELYGRCIVPGWTVYGNQVSGSMFDE